MLLVLTGEYGVPSNKKQGDRKMRNTADKLTGIRYYENGDITTRVQYHFAGYDRNGKPVYGRDIVVFSIARGVILDTRIAPTCHYFSK
jgi:hypothetical protein